MSRARWPIVAGAINCGVVMTVALGLLLADEGPPDAVQPIAFNHKLHVEAEVECLMCHAGLTDRTESRIPTVETCTMCHFDEPGDNPGLTTLAEHEASGEELEWKPLFSVPDHVFFSHTRHVEVGGLECVECHADMPERTSPPLHRRTIDMGDCIDCHKAHEDSPSAARAIYDCAACHR